LKAMPSRCFLVAALGLVGATAPALAQEAPLTDVLIDDACEAGRDSLELRQLRSRQTFQDAAAPDDEVEGDSSPFCCGLVGDWKNRCGSCRSQAEEGDSCAAHSTCGGCGGYWCKPKCMHWQPKDDLTAPPPVDKPKTTPKPKKQEEPEDEDEDEGEDDDEGAEEEDDAEEDDGEEEDAEEALVEQSDRVVQDVAKGRRRRRRSKTAKKVPVEKDGSTEFCCLASRAGSSDKCGNCLPASQALAGDFCASHDTCGSCGGQWCKPECTHWEYHVDPSAAAPAGPAALAK